MKPPVTRADLECAPDGPAIRLRDLMALTGLSRNTLFGDIQRGALVAWRRDTGPGTPFLIDRRDALAFLRRMRRPAA